MVAMIGQICFNYILTKEQNFMPSFKQANKVKVAVNDIEFVDRKQRYLKVSSPSTIESVRAMRKAAGLKPKSTGPSSAITGPGSAITGPSSAIT